MIANEKTMVFREFRCTRILTYFLFIVFSVNANSWDLAVTIGNEINFLGRNGSLHGKAEIPKAVALVGLAYDPNARTIYFSDTQSNISLYSLDLTKEHNEPKPLLIQEQKSHIAEMLFDEELQSVFWADTLKQSIMKMDIRTRKSEIFHNLTGKYPYGIAIDACNRYLYWTNSNRVNGSIERSRLDATERQEVIKDDLYQVMGITIDHAAQKLYWIDDMEGTHYRIERSDLNGSNREVVIKGEHHQPLCLAMDKEHIYWTDLTSRQIWKARKDANITDSPIVFKSWEDRYEKPMGIIANDKEKIIECAAEISNVETSPGDEHLDIVSESIQINTYEIVKNDSKRKSVVCFNNGIYNETDHICHCEPGFRGATCEMSVCNNYCFEGNCSVDESGIPRCKCSSSFDGFRCERNQCDGYCMNGGRCSIENDKPYCHCKYSNASRCESSPVDFVELCTLFCASGRLMLNYTDVSSCICSIESSAILQQVLHYDKIFGHDPLLVVFSAIIILLLITVTILSFYVKKLKQRPRIKKRYVVNRPGTTALTSRPQFSGDQCEITIENCCNMNICETPCFEPKLRNARPADVKKDGKNSLLDNMENNIF